jgi:hypothetical protein
LDPESYPPKTGKILKIEGVEELSGGLKINWSLDRLCHFLSGFAKCLETYQLLITQLKTNCDFILLAYLNNMERLYRIG